MHSRYMQVSIQNGCLKLSGHKHKWIAFMMLVGEYRNPGRDLPRVIHPAMPMVIASYLLANMAYFFVLPLDTIGALNATALTKKATYHPCSARLVWVIKPNSRRYQRCGHVVYIIIGFATKPRQESFTQLRTEDFSDHLAE
ncbi:hypothetical protein VE00_05153 [Pseudogymnoascus sp. WSF 3629]|nr:hypothetical protein VE00_05153 [Pseudogymnoascus sp. WSF 3629]